MSTTACPSCSSDMALLTLDGQLETRIDLDVCRSCQAIWFDRYESLRLSPGSTLQLFKLIGDRDHVQPGRLREPMKCPRCSIRLLFTHDRQRNTPFNYWRCPKDHGRLTTYFDFLREKDFIRPLSPAQLAELRRNIQMVNCSNCGAAIDLGRESVCAHCGTPISTLDLQQIADMAVQLQRAGERQAQRTPDVDTLFALLRTERDRAQNQSERSGVVEAGLQLVARWLSSY